MAGATLLTELKQLYLELAITDREAVRGMLLDLICNNSGVEQSVNASKSTVADRNVLRRRRELSGIWSFLFRN